MAVFEPTSLLQITLSAQLTAVTLEYSFLNPSTLYPLSQNILITAPDNLANCSITMPDATYAPTPLNILFSSTNPSALPINILNAAGDVIGSLESSDPLMYGSGGMIFLLTDNSTLAGTWTTIALGAQVPNPANWAGYGLDYLTNQKLNTENKLTIIDQPNSYTQSLDANGICTELGGLSVWTSGTGDYNLLPSSVLGAGFVFSLLNIGTGELSILPTGDLNTWNGSVFSVTNPILAPGESCTIVADGDNGFYGYNFPPVIGSVFGPNQTTVNNLVEWNSVDGTQIKDAGFTLPSPATGVPQILGTNGTTYGLGAPLVVALGGTGQATFAENSIPIVNGINAFGAIQNGSAGQVVTSTGATTAPIFADLPTVPLAPPITITQAAASTTLTVENTGSGNALVAEVTGSGTAASFSSANAATVVINNTGGGANLATALVVANANTNNSIAASFSSQGTGETVNITNNGTGVGLLVEGNNAAQHIVSIEGTAEDWSLNVTNQSTSALVANFIAASSGAAVNISNTGSGPSLLLTPSLAVPSGGTGAGTFTNNGVLIGSGINPIQSISPGTAGQLLSSNGSSTLPSFQSIVGNQYYFEAFQNSQFQMMLNGDLFGLATFPATPTGCIAYIDHVFFYFIPSGAVFTVTNTPTFNFGYYNNDGDLLAVQAGIPLASALTQSSPYSVRQQGLAGWGAASVSTAQLAINSNLTVNVTGGTATGGGGSIAIEIFYTFSANTSNPVSRF